MSAHCDQNIRYREGLWHSKADKIVKTNFACSTPGQNSQRRAFVPGQNSQQHAFACSTPQRQLLYAQQRKAIIAAIIALSTAIIACSTTIFACSRRQILLAQQRLLHVQRGAGMRLLHH